METLEAGGVGSDESEIRSTCNGGERGGLEAVCIYLQYVETKIARWPRGKYGASSSSQ